MSDFSPSQPGLCFLVSSFWIFMFSFDRKFDNLSVCTGNDSLDDVRDLSNLFV